MNGEEQKDNTIQVRWPDLHCICIFHLTYIWLTACTLLFLWPSVLSCGNRTYSSIAAATTSDFNITKMINQHSLWCIAFVLRLSPRLAEEVTTEGEKSTRGMCLIRESCSCTPHSCDLWLWPLTFKAHRIRNYYLRRNGKVSVLKKFTSPRSKGQMWSYQSSFWRWTQVLVLASDVYKYLVMGYGSVAEMLALLWL